jgi:CheY-like chemotaxis protein
LHETTINITTTYINKGKQILESSTSHNSEKYESTDEKNLDPGSITNTNSKTVPTYCKISSGPSKKEYYNDQVCFINYTQKYCIGFVNVIDSIELESNIKDPRKLRKYYSLFLNKMSSIINTHNGKIVKNGVDNLFFYFPNTHDIYDDKAFQGALECGVKMAEYKTLLDQELSLDNLSPIGYRISMDYGEVEIAMPESSKEVDLFGPVVNNCAKINSMIANTGIIIGENLFKTANRAYFAKNYNLNEIDQQRDSGRSFFGKAYSLTKNDTGKINSTEETGTIYRKHWSRYENKEANQVQRHKKPIDNRVFRIIIIDDDEDVLFTYKTMLTRQGHDVKTFSKPLEAFNHFSAGKPNFFDLILLDIRMPDISGFKLYYRLKAVNPSIPILFITALEVVDELLDALPGINAEHIIKKPIESEVLLEKINGLLA